MSKILTVRSEQDRSLDAIAFRNGHGMEGISHLSKRLSDLKHNGTQEKAPFSGTVFNTLSPGVISYVASVSSKNHLLTG